MNKRGSTVKHLLRLLTLFLCICSMDAGAAEHIDISRSGRITLSYPVRDIPFRLYKVADLRDDTQLTWTEQFERYGESVSLVQTAQSGWESAAQTLSGYASRDQLVPYAQQSTDFSGQVTFPIDTVGMYLVDWNTHQTGASIYSPRPYLITVPMQDTSGAWI